MGKPTKSSLEDLARQHLQKEVTAASAKPAPASPVKAGPFGQLIMKPASTVRPEAIRWMWPGKIALGKPTLIAGDPGLGKSMVTASLAAHVSTGRAWPDGSACPLGDVIFCSAEDDPGDTIRPRLDAAGADPARVYIVHGVEEYDRSGQCEQRLLNLRRDLEAIATAAAELTECRLIVIDPVSAYLGGADSHNNAEVRGLLAPLGDLARKIGAAIVFVTHLNKGSGGSALYRATGSLAFVAAARAAFIVTRDNADNERRYFLPMKNNLAQDVAGMAYRIQERGGAPYVQWEAAPVTITAEEALQRDDDGDHESTLATDAEEWLREVLALGPVPSKEIVAAAKSAGYSWATIRRAQAAIKIRPSRAGGAGAEGKWVWQLPDDQQPQQMALPTGGDS